jgi:hypothetical protein
MRTTTIATLALSVAVTVATAGAAQACWDRSHHRSAKVYGYGPVYGYGATSGYASRPQISQYGPTENLGPYESSSVKMAPSWWREPRRR